ncbi:serine/threonine-protein kinase PknG [Krasilnikovia cinnamomea]|uniref:non-specific serine/threonine protein kinase n=1 Tax=Krasilnikovia cinnamomea TaxID=349313 RepID=A0A4Q7ZCV6_9ACTN|nr:serine/threonine-protein kinase [Krasilnikovia cinnamomea]RZU48507.1 serine/threonine-protein kinase PknG [Krasilnikovia cinnamomea]
MTCPRDCPGTIQDGYCDTCGMAPPAAAKATGSSGLPAQRTATAPSVRTGALSTRTGGSGRSGSASGSRRRRFGGGLVDVAPLPQRDPSTAVMAVAQVPEDKRYCAKCGQPVGRARGERPGRTAGFCPSCGEPFDFTPKLSKGDLVGGQYEVVGPLAHGGLGWIYLAVDKNVSDRWVVLKGLLNSGDEDALAAAVAERRFLAEVEHPNIVKIYNFVEHDGAGYIVMEYVGGDSLKSMLKARMAANAGNPDPLPVDQALAYVLEIMPAFGYLHDRGLVFCDFKPDNVIQTGDQVKLIDLGGVVRVDDLDSAIYGTVGYQAPEMATAGPSIQSDLYTIGRTLAVLTTDFRGYQSTYADSLPERDAFAVYRRNESYYRLLQRATRTDPAERFVDAAEMSEQLLGVLREVLAADGQPHPAPSRLFTGELRTDTRDDEPNWRFLPAPLIDLTDPAAAFLASVTVTDPQEVLTLLGKAPENTIEVQLRALRALIDLGAAGSGPDAFADARTMRDTIAAGAAADWRLAWYDGVLALASGDAAQAVVQFDAVYSALPGELAPKLALGLAYELAGQPGDAAARYDVVSRTDPAYTTAAAGLARCRLAAGDRGGAVEAYNRVPGTSSAYRSSQVGAVRALVRPHASAATDVAALAAAAALIDRLEVEAAQLAALRAELLEQALDALAGGAAVPAAVLGGAGAAARSGGANGSAEERDVRFALEAAYRELARAAHGAEKIRLVDLANAARPRTRT